MLLLVESARTQINRLNIFIGPHLGRRSFSNQLAAIEHDDPIGMFEHDVHVVFGEQHGQLPLLGNAGGELHQQHTFFGCHASGRLIHQQQLGISRKGNGKFEPFDVAIRQFTAGAFSLFLQSDQVEKFIGLDLKIPTQIAEKARGDNALNVAL